MQSLTDSIRIQYQLVRDLEVNDIKVIDIGDIKWSVRVADFGGWLLCDGREVAKINYPELYAVIGNSFGSPSDADLFKLPNGRGRVLGGINSLHSMGQYVGNETITLGVNQLPAHSHTGTTDSAGTHDHGGSTGTNGSAHESETVEGGSGATVAGSGTHAHTISSDGAHTHTFTTNNTGSGDAVSVMQPTLFVGNMFIYGGGTGVPYVVPT